MKIDASKVGADRPFKTPTAAYDALAGRYQDPAETKPLESKLPQVPTRPEAKPFR